MASDAINETPPPGEAAADLLEFVRLLRRRFQATPAEIVRVEAVSIWLRRQGVRLRDPSAVHYLSPLVCSSPDEQERFLVEHASWRAGLDGGSARDVPAATPAMTEKAAPWRKWYLLATIVLAIALGVCALTVTRTARLPTVESTFRETITRPTVTAADVAGRALLTAGWLALAAIATLAGAWLFLALRRRRRRRLRQAEEPSVETGEQQVYTTIGSLLFGDQKIRRSIATLRRHRATPSRRLHVPRSLRATVRRGGLPTLRFGTRPVTPDYVILAERRSPRDHLPFLADLLTRRLREEHVEVSLYEFAGEPVSVQRRQPAAEAFSRGLADLTALHPGARLLMVGDERFAAEIDGETAWADELRAAFDEPVALTPKPASPAREEPGLGHGRASGVGSPLSEGIIAYAESLRRGRDNERTAASDVQCLSPTEAQLVSDDPPDGYLVEQVVADLRHRLDAEAFRLLCAVCVFPLVEPALTLLTATRLDPGIDSRALERRFLQVGSLPPMRLGAAPSWLRTALARELGPADLGIGINAAVDLLEGRLDADARTDVAGARRRLAEWIDANGGSEFADPLFRDALSGRPRRLRAGRREIALRRLRERARASRRDLAIVAGPVAALLAAVIAGDLSVGPIAGVDPTLITSRPSEPGAPQVSDIASVTSYEPVGPAPVNSSTAAGNDTTAAAGDVLGETAPATAGTARSSGTRRDERGSARGGGDRDTDTPGVRTRGDGAPPGSGKDNDAISKSVTDNRETATDRNLSLPRPDADPAYAAAEARIIRQAESTRTLVPVGVVAPAGVWTRIDQVKSYRPDKCEVFAPAITNIIQPLRGTIEQRATTVSIQVKGCGEITGPATDVFYRPPKGYQGRDIVAYKLEELDQTTILRIIIDDPDAPQ